MKGFKVLLLFALAFTFTIFSSTCQKEEGKKNDVKPVKKENNKKQGDIKKPGDPSWIKIPDDAPAEYKKWMEEGKKMLLKKDYAEAAKSFGAALRVKPKDELAERGFREAIKELEIYNTRFGELKENTIKEYCGDLSKDVKDIVSAGLKWLVKVQKEEGFWEGRRPHGHATDDKATTALALMALLADGNSEVTGSYKENVKKGIDWLIKQQNSDGGFGGATLYTEGIVVLAITEAFVMGGTEKSYEAAQKGINFVVKKQREGGGWMYNDHTSGDGDTSVSGNMFQSLKQAQMAFMDFDYKALEKAVKYIDATTDEEGWVYYRANKAEHKTPALTAIGNLIRIYAGVKLDNEKVQKGLKIVREHKDDAKDNIYFMYFGTMIAFLAGGDMWKEWRDMMVPHFKEKQIKEGEDAGSWAVEGALSLSHKGSNPLKDYISQADMTAMTLLCLECCYRYVPKNMLPK